MNNNEFTGKLVLVAEWFRTKQIYQEGIANYPQYGDVTRETEKAVLINNSFWAPKKCVLIAA